MRIVAAVITICGLAAVCSPALAVPRQREIVAQAGMPSAVNYYTHFKPSTCQAISMPSIVIRRQPMKGTLLFAEKVMPLQKVSGARARNCIGKPIRSVVVQYIPWANASGHDEALYDVIYPRTCPLCQRFDLAA